jgi:hypothetical protein
MSHERYPGRNRVYGDYWNVRAENDEWYLPVTDEGVEVSLGIERGGRE